jgi:hypothetical protein
MIQAPDLSSSLFPNNSQGFSFGRACTINLFFMQWKGSNCKQSARWQHVSRLKAVFGKINYGGLKHNSLYLGLVLPSGE